VKVGANTVLCNEEATCWLGVCRLDSQLTLKDRHAVRLKNRKNVKARLRRLAEQMGLSPANCREVMAACIQSVAMFRSELWWKGDQIRGTCRKVNQEARATTDCFRTTSLGAL